MEKYGLECVRKYAEDGLSDAEIAEKTEISKKTLKKWKSRNPEIAYALYLGRQGSDFAVVEAIYKKATGYTVSLNKTVKLKKSDFDPETGKKIRDYEELATATDESYVPADIRAGLFWLKSRQPERWSEKPGAEEHEDFTGVVELPEADSIDAEDENE